MWQIPRTGSPRSVVGSVVDQSKRLERVGGSRCRIRSDAAAPGTDTQRTAPRRITERSLQKRLRGRFPSLNPAQPRDPGFLASRKSLRGGVDLSSKGHSAFFDFQLVLIVSNELFDFVPHREELVPLLLVESDRKPAQPVDGNRPFFAHLHRYGA